MKICKACGQKKNTSEFHKNKNNDQGLSSTCKCCAIYASRIWYRNNPEHARNTRFVKMYGITLAKYNEMLAAQGGVCAVCKRPSTQRDPRNGRFRALAVDHCHKTGRVRALLCRMCNYWLGAINEDVTIAREMVSYINSRCMVSE